MMEILTPRRGRATVRTFVALALVLGAACARGKAAGTESAPVAPPVPERPAVAPEPDSTANEPASAASYEGVDARGIPHYATVPIAAEDSILLRRAYGIEDPHRLYVSDSTEEGILKYDTRRKACLTCYVNSYRVGYVSVRRRGESWEEAERRVRATRPSAFAGGGVPSSASTADLDPDVRPVAEAMLREARAAGFHLRVTATYRSPEREAYLMAEGQGRTHTLTSNHSYGRALDVVVDDGDRGHRRTREDWIAFRRWVTHRPVSTGEGFRVLGRVDRTWDWPHVELPSETIGFDTIEGAVRRARACLAPGAAVPCDFPPHLPSSVGEGQRGR